MPFTGCGINPARTFGPLVVDSIGGLEVWGRGWWIFFTAPFLGSWLAVITYQFIFFVPTDESEKLSIAVPKQQQAGDEESIVTMMSPMKSPCQIPISEDSKTF